MTVTFSEVGESSQNASLRPVVAAIDGRWLAPAEWRTS
jgi:hypothetical protein